MRFVMRDTVERLSSATDATAVAEAIADHLERTIGFGSFGFLPFLPGLVGSRDLVVRSSEFPHRVMVDSLLGASAAVDRDKEVFGGLAAFGPGSFDVSDRFPRARVERTSVFRDFWVPFKLERQLVTYLGPTEPIGFFCITRSRRERPFARSHLRVVEGLRAQAERSLAAIRWTGSRGLDRTLDALTRSLPSPAFLFDADGHLRWMSDDGALRLSVDSVRVGSSRLVRGNRLLRLLSRTATALVKRPAELAERAIHGAGALRPGERVVARRFDDVGRPLLLLLIEPALAGVPRHAATPATAPRLGGVESCVAGLAAQGYAVLNIAAILAVSESTVRTHLRRIYVKLGVHNRAELACALMRSGVAPP